jgi:PAS domain S-box-containing protein
VTPIRQDVPPSLVHVGKEVFIVPESTGPEEAAAAAAASSTVDDVVDLEAVVPLEVAAGEVAQAAEQSRHLVWQVAVDAAGVGSFDWDVSTGVLFWDERFGVLFGYDQEEGLRPGTASFPSRVHPEDLPRVNAAMAAAIATCGDYSAEYRVVHPNGRVLWVASRGRVLAGASGRAERMLGAAYDITAARQAQELAERTARRAELLARVTVELTETLDADQAVGRLVDLLVPDLADWCIVSLVPDDRPDTAGAHPRYQLRDVGWAHVDPAVAPVLRLYLQARIPALTEANPVARALRTGHTLRLPADATKLLQESLVSGLARDLIGRLAPETALLVPLRARGRTVGLISLYNGPARGALSVEDEAVIQDVAGRAGLALDNTRLYQQQRRVAEELQRAMLTDPPQAAHLQFAVRYVPAGQAAQVGGDWYDAFTQPGGVVTVTIGDVVGHDVAAAAAMGQLRSMLRNIAAHTGAGPADVLYGLDTAMRTLRMSLTATAVVARIEQTPAERAAGSAHLHWSSAGHPPPVILEADGTVTDLADREPDLLLGLDPDLARTEHTFTLTAGATLLLYTDGLIERRDQPLDEGLGLLHQRLTGLATRSVTLDELCDDLLAHLLPPHPQDDVALIAVRLTPTDVP